MRKKVTVVGGGFVGSTRALRIIDRGLAGVVLTDILEGVPARSQREPRVRAVLAARAIRVRALLGARAIVVGVVPHP